MSTTTYPFGADHDDRDRARVRADLSARGTVTGGRTVLLRLRRRARRAAGGEPRS